MLGYQNSPFESVTDESPDSYLSFRSDQSCPGEWVHVGKHCTSELHAHILMSAISIPVIIGTCGHVMKEPQCTMEQTKEVTQILCVLNHDLIWPF